MKLLGRVKIGYYFCGFLDMDKCYEVAYSAFHIIDRFIHDDGEYGLQSADFIDSCDIKVKQGNILVYHGATFCRLPGMASLYIRDGECPEITFDKKYIEVIILTDVKLKYGLFFRFTEENRDNIKP